MAFVIIITVATVFGIYGYWRGGIRFGLAFLPLLCSSLLVWLLGPTFYQIDSLRNAGLLCPGTILLLAGLGGGYIIRLFIRRTLSKEIRRADRIVGLALGLFVSVFVVWLGCVYWVVLSSANRSNADTSTAEWLAGTLNATMIQWIPGVGVGSDAMMSMMEIATANESVRRDAIEDLGLRHLVDIPEMKAVIADEMTQADVQAAAAGSIAAVLRLQKNPLILNLLETEEIVDVFSSRTLNDFAKAVRKASRDNRNKQ